MLAFRADHFFQVTAERLQHGEDHPAVAGVDRYPFNKVEITIAAGFVTDHLVIVVEAVQAHQAEQGCFPEVGNVGQEGDVHSRVIILIDDAHLEPVLFDLSLSEVINVFHHQVPHRVVEVIPEVTRLQELQYNGIRFAAVDIIFGQLTYPVLFYFIGARIAVGIFVGHGQYFIITERRSQGDIPQVRIELKVGLL
ncbi:hypothetical protein FQZ97_873760 [compost metagenome]